MSVADSTPTPAQVVPQPVPAKKRFAGLLAPRTVLLPTFRGWALLAAIGLSLTITVILLGRHLCEFLSVRDLSVGGVLVVEGWVPPSTVRGVVAEFQRHPYLGIYATGEPIEEGNPYIGFHTFAEFTARRLKDMGAPPDRVHAAPAPFVARDRTFATAVHLREQLKADGLPTDRITLITVGPHARRSRLIYEMAFPGAKVGTIAVAADDFDERRWWTTSAGVRAVISESIAYFYARFLFRPGDS